MAQAFNLTAQLNLRGPSNIKTIVADIKRQLGTVQGTVNFTIDPRTTRNVSQLESALRNLNTAFTQTQNNATAAANAIRTFNNSIGNIGSSTNNINRSMNNAANAAQNLGRQTTSAAQQTKIATSEMEEFGKQSALAVRRFAAFSSVTSVIFAFTNALTKGMTAFVAFDKEFVKLQQVTDSSASQLKGLSDEITSLSKNFGVASADLMTVASTLAQAGLSAKDTERALKALALTDLAPSFDSMNDTVEGSIALMRQFSIGAKDLEKALGSINSVAAVFAVEASDIITAIQRTGGVFASASKGVSQGTDALNEFIAVFTSVRQTTRESAETIATGLRTIFTRIQRESTIEALREFGVVLTDLEGKFVGPYEAVRKLSEGLSRLDPRDLKFSQIVEELGGFRQIGKVIPLIQEFAVAQEALGVAQRGQGSLAQDAVKAQLSLANQMAKVREEFLALMRDIGNSDTFQAIAKSALGFTSVLIKVADSVKGILPVLAIMGAGKAASGIAQFATGFIGGLKRGPDGQTGGGGGGGGIISRMTGGGSNNQTNIGVRELILVSDALRNNTSSLGLNTSAIEDLTRAINNSGRSPFANGGIVRKFARGGVVPGSGDRDTVPAMLQPGEFVIRKKAVETIGADNLHSMNKYGSGGSIRGAGAGKRKRFAKGGVAKIQNKGARDGDSWNAEYIPSEDPIATTTRGIGYDAYEINKGQAWEKALGKKATDIANKYFTDSTKMSDSSSLFKSIKSGKFTFGRPLHDVPEQLKQEMFSLGVAKKANKDNTATGSGGPTTKQFETLREIGFNTRNLKPSEYNFGGKIQKFAGGGKVLRNIGIIDTDILRDPANASIVRAAMEKLGITDVSDYTTKLGELAAKARKSESLSKFRAIAGAAGSGKSSLATGKGANDNATLRKTTRSQILTPEDIDKVNEVIVLTSTASQAKLDAYLKDVDRAYVLSSNSIDEQDQIRSNRDSRDATGEGLYGRKPGTTRGATADFGLDETVLRDELGKKATVLGRKENSFGLRRKKESELPEIIQAGGFYTGGFAPPTRGHRGALDTLLENMLAKNPNASLEDIVVSVAPDLPMIAGKEGIEHAARYGIFPADFRALLSQANFGDAMISTQDQPPGSLPKFMEVAGSGDRRKFARLKGAMAITSGKEEGVLGKYARAGMDVKDIPRIEDISATKVRDALFAGDDKTLTSFLDPNIASILMGNRAQLRNRSMMVPMLIEEIQKFVDQEKERSNTEVSSLLSSALGGPYKNVSAKLKENAPEVVSQIQEIRNQRDRLSRGAFGYRAFNIIRALSAKYPEIYGLDPSRKSAVSAQPSDITKEAIAAQLSEQMSGEFGGVSTAMPSGLEEAILKNVEKSTQVKKSSGILPAQGSEILKRFGAERLPNDPSFGPFSGKTVRDTADGGKLKYWNSAFRPETKADKLAYYTATRDYLIDKFNESQGTQKATALAETTNAILSSKQLGLVGLNPLGYTGLLGPETWNLGTDSSGQERTIDASIVQRGLPTQYQNVIDYLSGQTEEIVGGASKLLGITPKKLTKKQRETLGQGNIEGALLEQIFGSADATILDDALRTRPIDFPMGIGPKAAQIFGIDPDIPTEVKRTIDSGSRSKAIEEFQRYFRQQYGIPEPQKLAEGGETYSSSQLVALAKYRGMDSSIINRYLSNKAGFAKWAKDNGLDDTYIQDTIDTGNQLVDMFKNKASLEGSSRSGKLYSGVKAEKLKIILSQIGTQLDSNKDIPNAIGKTFNLGGSLLSTSESYDTAEGFANSTNVSSAIMSIIRKRGTSSLDVDKTIFDTATEDDVMQALSEYNDKATGQTGADLLSYVRKNIRLEKEFVLPPDAKFRILDIDSIYPKDAPDKLVGGNIRHIEGMKVEQFAKGGSAQDTVPALLTPGEFVINKKAAQNIGYTKLNQLNKADKIQGYNKGGFVGVQKFSDGGTPASVGASGGFIGFDFNDEILSQYTTKSARSLQLFSATIDAMLLKIPTLLFKATEKASIKLLGWSSVTESLTNRLEKLDTVVPGLATAIIDNGLANKRSVAGQDNLIDSVYRTTDTMASAGQDYKGWLRGLKQNLEENTSSITGQPVNTSPTPGARPYPEAYASQIDYSDVTGMPGNIGESGRKYATALSKEDPAKIEAVAQKLQAEFEAAMNSIGANISKWGKSQSWAKWDIGKQLYMNANPDESNSNYRLANPLEDAQLQKEMVQRMVGWEITGGGKDPDTGKSIPSSALTAKGAEALMQNKNISLKPISDIVDSWDTGESTKKVSNSNADDVLSSAKVNKECCDCCDGSGSVGSSKDSSSGDKNKKDDSSKANIDAKILSSIRESQGMAKGTPNAKSTNSDFNQLLQLQGQLSNSMRKKLGPAFTEVSNAINAKDYNEAAKTLVEIRKQMGSIAKIPPVNINDLINFDTSNIASIEDAARVYSEMTDAIGRMRDSGQTLPPMFTKIADEVAKLGDVLADEATTLEEKANQLNQVNNDMKSMGANMPDQKDRTKEMQDRLNRAALAVAGIGSAISNFAFNDESKSSAVGKAVVGGASTTVGAGLALASNALSLPPPLGPAVAALVAAGTAAVTIVGAFKDAHNAALEFEKTLANKNLQMSMDRTASAFEDFAKDIKNLQLLDDAKTQIETAGSMAQRGQDLTNNIPKAFWVNMVDAFTSSDQKGAADRSKILEKDGVTGYLRSTAMFGGGADKAADYTNRKLAEYAPAQSLDQAKAFKPVADATLQLFENKLKTGTSMDDVMKELKDATGAPTQLAKNIALANPNIQELILNIQANNALSEEQKRTSIDNIIAKEAERKATLDLERTLREVEIEKLNKATNAYVNSLERTFKQMEASIGKASFELDKLSASSEAYNAALSGSAKASSVNLKSINVLQNSRAYSGSERDAAGKQAGEFFGGTSGNLEGMLKVGDKLESNIISTINRTIQEDPNASEEKIAAKIRTNTESTVQDAGLSKDLSSKLATEVQKAVADIRKGGDKGPVDFDQLVEKVPALGKTLDGARRAQELANKALEYWQKNLNEYANAMNQSMEMQLEANARGRRAVDIQVKGAMELQKALGKEVTLREQVSSVLDSTSRQTKGLSSPSAIGDNIVKLNERRTVQQGMSDTAANRGASGKNEFMDMQQRLRNTNMALRENYDALKNMAENTEIASAALAKINEVQQKRQAGVNIAERLVTSSPEELSKLNSAMARLSNNMAGVQNVGTTADQRKESLDAFNMIAPLLGPDQGAMKANMLESMLGESGVGVSPMMKDVLDSLRNPEEDPMMREAIETYKMGVNLQSDANSELARMSQLMSDNTAEVAAEKIAQSLSKVELSFETQIFDDIRTGIRRLVEIEENKKNDVQDAQGKARGGLIYASAGQMIDFAPKGTDTVPAMLTPGEFVVNRSATQKHLPLLKNINSNKYSSGGKVKYYDKGGFVSNNNYTNEKEGEDRGQSSLQENKETKKTYPVLDKLTEKEPIELFTIAGGAYLAGDKAKSDSLSSWFLNKGTPPSNIGMNPTLLIGPGYDRYALTTGSTANRWAGALGVTAAGATVIAATVATGGAAGVALGGALGASATVGAGITAAGVAGGAAAGGAAWKYATEEEARQSTSGKDYIAPVGAATPAPTIKSLGKFLNYSGSKIDHKSLSADNKEIAAYIEKANQILAINRDFKLFKDVIESKKKSLPTPRPKLEPTDTGATLEGLAQPIPADTYTGLFDGDTKKGIESRDPNIYGFQIGFYDPTVRGWAKLVSGLQNINAMTPDMASLMAKGPIYDPSNPNIKNSNYDNQVSIIEDVSNAVEELSGGKVSFAETQESINNKKYVKDIDELYRGSKLSAIFENKDVINIPDAVYPVTVFGEAFKNKWKDVKTAAESLNGKFSADPKDYINFSEKDPATGALIGEPQDLPWLDAIIAENQKIQDIINGAQADFNADPTKANVFDAGSAVFDNGRYYFTYQKLKARFFNDTARRFMSGDQKEFMIIRNQAAESAALNPFADLGPDQNIYVPGNDISSLITALDAGTPPAGQSGNPGAKPEEVEPYKYKLKKILKAQNIDSLTGVEKSWAFKSNGNANEPGLEDVELIAKAYTVAREKALLNNQLNEDKADVKKVFRVEDRDKKAARERKPGESDADYQARMVTVKAEAKAQAKEEAWTEAKRVTLGRAIYAVANQAGIKFSSALPVNIPTVGGVAVELGQYITKMPTDSPQRAILDAYRAFFAELYNNGETAKSSKEAAEGSDSGSFLKSLGIDISDKAFGGPGPMVRIPGSTTETVPAYYTSTTNDAAKINAILARQFMAERSKQFAGALSEEKKEELTVDASATGAKIYTINPDGTKSLRKGEEIVPKSYADIFDMALTPENLFPDADVRQKYLDQLISYYTTAANAQGQALFSPQMSQPFVDSLNVLKTWYKVQDTVLNASRTPEQLSAISTALQAVRDGNISDSLQKQFQDITGMSIDDIKTQAEQARDQAQQANAFLTTNKYGELPDLSRMISLLNVQAAEKAQENKQQQTQALSSGGVVYASTGKLINFQPRGTDTVPAMLTPGEFVVNRGATQRHLPILEAINSGNYSRGDIVQHLSRGGLASGYYQVGGPAGAGLAGFDFSSFMNDLVGQVSSAITEAAKSAFDSLAKSNTSSGGVSNSGNQNFDGISDFTSKLDRISSTLASLDIPREITITGKHDVNVIINGDQALSQLTPNIKDMVMTELKKGFERLVAINNPVPSDSLKSPYS